MSLFLLRSRSSHLALVSTSLALLVVATPLSAQKTVEGRVDKLEKEMQAVQRKVFPGAAGQIVAPDINPVTEQAQQAGAPATTPLTDLTARVNAIESQLARLTGQTEENGNRLRLLEESNSRLTAQVQALQARAQEADAKAAASAEAGAAESAAAIVAKPVASLPAAAAKPGAVPTKAKAPVGPKPDAVAQARVKAVAAIEHPSSGNAASDAYTYAFRLWTAKFYPEAQVQLEEIVQKYPNDAVASRAANLLGRAYLEDGKPTQAAKTLFANYHDRPKGDRAAESLAWLGEALIQLNRMKDACTAYAELKFSFGAKVPANVRDMATKGRARAKCSD